MAGMIVGRAGMFLSPGAVHAANGAGSLSRLPRRKRWVPNEPAKKPDLFILGPLLGPRRVVKRDPVVPSARFADCGHRPSLMPAWRCCGFESTRFFARAPSTRHARCPQTTAIRDWQGFLSWSSFSRHMPGRVAWGKAIPWFPPSALRTAFTDRLALMPPACWR